MPFLILAKIDAFNEAEDGLIFNVVLALVLLFPVPLSANTTVVTLTSARIIAAFLMNLSIYLIFG